MTRQILILVISVILVVFSGLWEINYLKETAQFGLSDVEYIQNMIENESYDAAQKNYEALKDTWDNMKPIWNIFVEHNEIDGVEETMTEYKVYIEQKNKEEAIKCGELITRYFGHVVNKQEINIGNIF